MGYETKSWPQESRAALARKYVFIKALGSDLRICWYEYAVLRIFSSGLLSMSGNYLKLFP